MSKQYTKDEMRQIAYDSLEEPILGFLTSLNSNILCAVLYGGFTKKDAKEMVDSVVAQLHAEYEEYKQAEYKYMSK